MKAVAIRTTHQEFEKAELAIDDFRAPELEAYLAALAAQ
jgi:hypothetical protein